MKKLCNLKFLAIALLIVLPSVLFFNSCDKKPKGGGNVETTVDEDKNNINASFDNTINLLTDLENGDLVKSVIKYLKLTNGDVLNEVWIKDMVNSWITLTGIDDYIETYEKFSLDYFKGNYNYDQTTKTWTKSDNSKLVLNFPIDPTTTTNNCTLTVSEYTDFTATITNKTYNLPSKINVSLTRDGIEIFHLITNVVWDNSSFITVTNAQIDIYTAPFTQNIAIQQVSTTEYNCNIKLMSGNVGDPIIISSNVKLTEPISESFFNSNKAPINTIIASLTKGSIKFDGSFDFAAYNRYSNITIDQLNSVFSAKVLYNSNEIGDLKFKTVNYNDELYIYYKDETSENTSVFYDPFITEIENIFNKYTTEQIDGIAKKLIAKK